MLSTSNEPREENFAKKETAPGICWRNWKAGCAMGDKQAQFPYRVIIMVGWIDGIPYQADRQHKEPGDWLLISF